MTANAAWWIQLLGLLSIEGLALAFIAMITVAWQQNPRLRRSAWRATIVAWLILWAGELGGIYAHRSPPVRHLPALKTASLPATPPIVESIPGESEPPGPAPTANVEVLPATASIPAPALGDGAVHSPRLALRWPAWLWLAGTILYLAQALLGRVLNAIQEARRRPKNLESSIDSQDRAAFARLQSRLGLKSVRLTVSPRKAGPFAFGLWRPTIALPRDFSADFTHLQREAMIAHELGHLAARDPWWLLLGDILCSAAWWHPCSHIVRRNLLATSEVAADQASSLVPGGSLALAEALVTLGRNLSESPARYGLGASGMALKSNLGARVSLLLSEATDNSPPSRLRTARISAAFVVLALALANLPLLFPLKEPPIKTLVKSAWTPSTEPREAKSTTSPPPSTGFGLAYLNEPRVPSWFADMSSIHYSAERTRIPEDFGPSFHPFELAYINHGLAGIGNIATFPVRADRTPSTPKVHKAAPEERVPPTDSPSGENVVPPAAISVARVPAEEQRADPSPQKTPPPSTTRITPSAPPQKVVLKVHWVEITGGTLFGRVKEEAFKSFEGTEDPPAEVIHLPVGKPPFDGAEPGTVEIQRLGVTNQWKALSAKDHAKLTLRLFALDGIDYLTLPSLPTESGANAQLSILNPKSIVTGPALKRPGELEEYRPPNILSNISSGGTSRPRRVEFVYHTDTNFLFGPSLDVKPVKKEGEWHLDITAVYDEFLGYCDPGKRTVKAVDERGRKITAKSALPVIRSR
ncbi:MAG TPA: M56 family metallopeptidase, partial [Candidatus Limnocylindria bacterium]|nr:M56 family metallopeptidase [Candidatus Limnocylindria bacterium]